MLYCRRCFILKRIGCDGMGDDSKRETIKLSDLQPDGRNANKGSERGAYMIRRSLEKLGAGRSILLDKNGRIIAGNKTAEGAGEIGLEDVIVVRTDGRRLVAVLREDRDLDSDDGRAREMAVADNRAGQVGLEWDSGVLADYAAGGVDLGDWFKSWELDALTGFAHGDTPDLDDLESEYGDHDDRSFWPFIRVQVAPETAARWAQLMKVAPGGDDAEKAAAIVGAVDESAML